MVPGGGVEPPRPCDRRILSPLRLPVPPSRPCNCNYAIFNDLIDVNFAVAVVSKERAAPLDGCLLSPTSIAQSVGCSQMALRRRKPLAFSAARRFYCVAQGWTNEFTVVFVQSRLLHDRGVIGVRRCDTNLFGLGIEHGLLHVIRPIWKSVESARQRHNVIFGIIQISIHVVASFFAAASNPTDTLSPGL